MKAIYYKNKHMYKGCIIRNRNLSQILCFQGVLFSLDSRKNDYGN